MVHSVLIPFIITLLVVFHHLVVYASDYGVEPGTGQYTVFENFAESRGGDVLTFLWGKPAEDSLMLGMWSFHFVDNDDSYQTNNQLLGISYRGYYAGTFKNSHDNQTWTLGFQREFYQTDMDFLSVSVGYKAGLMYGYETMQLFDTKLFPLFQVYTNLSYKRAGIQLAWAGSVLTAGFVIKF